NPYSYPYLIYSFSIKRPASQGHVIKLECNFSLNAPATASYDLWISGSFGNGEILRKVRRDDLRDVDILFTIAKPGGAREAMDDRVWHADEVEEAHEATPQVAAGGAAEVIATVEPERILLIISATHAGELLAALTGALQKDKSGRERRAGLPGGTASQVAIVISKDCAVGLLNGLIANLAGLPAGLSPGASSDVFEGEEADESPQDVAHGFEAPPFRIPPAFPTTEAVGGGPGAE